MIELRKNLSVYWPRAFLTVILTASFFLLPISVAQTQDAPIVPQNFHRWGSVTLFNGLPSDSVRAIAQTSNGVMWFGTDNGLARFDGRRVQTVSLTNSGASQILALKTGPDGSLFVGTEKGAFRITGMTVEAITGSEDFAITSILPSEETLLATESGTLLSVTSMEGGSLRAESLDIDVPSGPNGEPLKITSLTKEGDQVIAGTAGHGILLFANGKLVDLHRGSKPYFVNSLDSDARGNGWIGAGGGSSGIGLYSFESVKEPKLYGIATGDVLAVKADGSGGVWAGTTRNGLFHFRGTDDFDHFTFENTSGNLRSNTIYSLFIDSDGVLWAGTNRGISRFDPASPYHQILADNVNSNFVRTIHRKNGGEIFAGSNRGLFKLAAGSWVEHPDFVGKPVYTIGEDASGSLLVGTPTALLDSSGKEIETGDVRAISSFKGRTYAALFGRGLFLINDEDSPPVFANAAITTLLVSGDKLIIGTAKDGVYSFDGLLTKREIGPDAIATGAIWKIIGDGQNGIWITGEQGLFRLVNGQIEKIIEEKDIRDVVVTDSDIWAATSNRGLIHLRRDEIFGPLTFIISTEQGLPSEKLFAMLEEKGRLIIGTNRGIATYSPGANAPQLLPVRILSRRLHDVGELESTIALEFPQNSILLEVAGQNSRTFPEEFQYGFLLKNASGDILEKRISNESQFSPGSLFPGEYSIEARAFNRDLLPSEPLVVHFSIAKAPFPWTATALGVLLTIALIALAWAIIERRRIVLRNRELAAARFDLANEAERERSRIARDLHDQTLADLRNLIMMSDKLTPGNTEFRDEIEAVSTEIRRICEDLSPSVLENVGLVAALEFLVSHTVENYKFSAAENIEDMIRFPVNVQLQIYRIAQEVLTNIRRHANAGLVEIEISVTLDEHFEMTIRDDGSSFELSENSTSGRGIPNIKSRASLIHANIDWKKPENGGTQFSLTKELNRDT